MKRVLIFPAGTEIGLEIHRALIHCKDIELYGAGQSLSNHAPYVFENFITLPSINDDGWLEALIILCKEFEIDYIFPAYDDIIVALAKNRELIPAVILTPSLTTCLVTRSKKHTYDELGKVVRVPKIYDLGDHANFPLIVKPDKGQGSQGVNLVHNETQLIAAYSSIEEPIISEYLPGDEYTIDCFSDRDHGLLFCGARVRIRMRNGISVNTKSIYLKEAISISIKIQASLKLYGAWFFQLKRNVNGELTLLEVAPRIAGSMCTHRVKGINFPLLTIYEHERSPISIIENPGTVELDRAFENRYCIELEYRSLYIDLDDTIIIREKVNLEALKLIYICINKSIPVILITRHNGNLDHTLKKHRLNALFDEIIHLRNGQPKSDYITDDKAIFIDDSFSERKQVHESIGIPTFDCSMIEGLISNCSNNNRTT